MNPWIAVPSAQALYTSTGDGVVRIFLDGSKQIFEHIKSGYSLEILGDKLYVNQYSGYISVYTTEGVFLRNIAIPSSVTHFITFVILPDERIALLDNQYDKVYFLDSSGNFITSVNILDVPDNHLQNVDGVVVNNELILSEDGNNHILQINLTTYQKTIFKDLSEIPSWLGAITYSNGYYYLCGPSSIYRFSENSGATKVAEIPDYNIVGIVVVNDYAYVSVNFGGKIYKVDLKSGISEVLTSGLNYPQDLEVYNPTTPDFSTSAYPTSLTIQQGNSGSSTITVTSINGFNQPVQLTLSGAPSGVTATLNPEQVTPSPDGSATSTLTVSVGATATLGSYTLTVTGTNDTLTHSTYISLEITAQPPPADTTPPTTPVVIDDGEYTSSKTSLNATWSSSDPESGIVEYQYAIGTSPRDTDVVDWTSAGTATEATRTGLNLILGATYYFSVKAKNGKGLWSEVGTSDGITVTTFTFDLSPGWGTKELFVPIFYRSREDPSTIALGVHNRRDMWYLVKVYKKMPDKTWMEIIPDEFLKGAGPYLGPWSEKTFLYTPQIGTEIKIQVWNDMNDGTLMALWGLDFVTRVLTGVRIPPKFLEYTDWQTLKSKLDDFYNDVVKPVKDDLLSKAWKSALIKICKAILKAPQLYSSILIDLGFEPSVAAGIIVKIGKFIEGALRLFAFFVNIPTWKDLLESLNREPFMEDVIFTAKYKVPPAIPDIRVTKSLTILQKEPYYVGQTIDAEFIIINKGTAPATFNVLTVGGRGPEGETDVRDFTFKTDITLNPGESYNYKGELKLLDNGTCHFFIAYQTSDGKWETSVPTEAGTVNTLNITVNPIPERWIAAELGSAGELRVYDPQNRVTGLVSGEEKNEIPYSTYYENIVVILASVDSYKYEIVGTGEGSYSLTVISVTEQETATFNATDIPTSANAIHQYTVDWAALSLGEGGVAVQVDSDGDGVFERTFASDSELGNDEFVLAAIKFYAVWEDVGYPVFISSNSTVSHFAFNQSQKQISFNITGLSGAKGYCNVTLPKSLLKGEPWTILVDNTPISFIQAENATHSFLYFTYTHGSTFQVVVQGTRVIPEFSSIMLLPLFTLTTLIATVLLKKKRKAKPQLP